jgi:hypothetical protein
MNIYTNFYNKLKLGLTFIVWIFKLPAALYGRNLNDSKSLNLQTFRKNAYFPFYAT